jgi:hypothetical protein
MVAKIQKTKNETEQNKSPHSTTCWHTKGRMLIVGGNVKWYSHFTLGETV